MSAADLSGLTPIESDLPASIVDEGDFYWHFDEQIPLHRVATEYLVRLTNDADPMEVIDDLTGVGGVLTNFSASVSANSQGVILKLLPGITPMPDPEDVDQAAMSVDGVAWTTPIFVGADNTSRVYLTDQIAVALAPEVAPEDFFATGYASWERLFDNQYIATIAEGGGLGSLELANALSSDPDVLWAAPNFYSDFHTESIPNDTLFGDQWGLNNTGQAGAKTDADVDAAEAWDVTTGSPNIVIGVLDNGVQTNHPDLSVYANPGKIGGNGIDDDGNGYIDDLNGWDFAGDDLLTAPGTLPDNNPNPTTQNDNHGTAVAGVAGALGNNGVGVSGTARNVRILPIKIARDDNNTGGGFVNNATIAKAVYYAAGIVIDVNGNPTGATWPGADVLVSGGSPSPVLTAAYDYIQTHGRAGRGVASFNASGNFADGTVPQLKYQVINLAVTPGQKQYVWSYQTNGDAVFLGENSAWITNITLPDGTHEFLDADTNPVGWTSNGNAQWQISDDYAHAYGTSKGMLRAGQLSQPNQLSNMWSPVINVASASTISFARYVSSQLQFDQFGNPIGDGLFLFEITNGGTPVAIWSAAGNPLPIQPVAYPASIASTIAVGASTDWDYRSAYSQFGAALDVVAPSSGGYAAVSTTDRTGSAGYNSSGDYTSTFNGTSAATPLAAGIAALMLSKDWSLTPSEIRTILHDTADKIGPNAGSAIYTNGFNQYYGYGRVNAAAAVLATPDELLGDVNFDHVVNIFDINLVSANWNTHGPTGDANHDRIVNIFDINLISSH